MNRNAPAIEDAEQCRLAQQRWLAHCAARGRELIDADTLRDIVRPLVQGERDGSARVRQAEDIVARWLYISCESRKNAASSTPKQVQEQAKELGTAAAAFKKALGKAMHQDIGPVLSSLMKGSGSVTRSFQEFSAICRDVEEVTVLCDYISNSNVEDHSGMQSSDWAPLDDLLLIWAHFNDGSFLNIEELNGFAVSAYDALHPALQEAFRLAREINEREMPYDALRKPRAAGRSLVKQIRLSRSRLQRLSVDGQLPRLSYL